MHQLQLYLLRPSAHWGLWALKILLYLVAFPLAGLAFFFGAARIFPTIANWPFIEQVWLSISCSLLALFFFASPVFRHARERIEHVEHWLFNMCAQVNYVAANSWRCLIVPTFYKLPFIEHGEQTTAINGIVSAITEEGNARFAIIEGPSGSGKTRSIPRVVSQVLRNRSDERFHSILFYDLSEPGRGLLLRGNIGGRTHRKALVIIDNLQLASDQTLWALTTHLENENLPEHFFVLMCQPIDMWRVNPGDHVRLIDMASSKGRLYSLKGLRSTSVSAFAKRQKLGVLVEALAAQNREYVANLAFTAVAASLSVKPLQANDPRPAVIRLMDEGEQSETSPDPELVNRLATVLSLAIHRGGFRRGDFLSYYWFLMSSYSLPQRVWLLIAGWRWLRSMQRLGLFPILATNYRRYVLHEKLAEEWKDILFRKASVAQVFAPVFTTLVREQLAQGNLQADLRWLLSIEARLSDPANQTADEAMTTMNFKRMTTCLERNEATMSQDEQVHFQYAMLLDKVGRFEEARQQLNHMSVPSNVDNPRFVRLALAKIEAEHGAEAIALLDQLTQSTDRYAVLAARYWRIHIDAHLGRFSPDGLLDLLDEITTTFLDHQGPYAFDHVYLASRAFFDGCRQSFLRGEQVADHLRAFFQHDVCQILKTHDTQYFALEALYGKAHWIAHECLPQFAVFGEQVSAMQFPPTMSHTELGDVPEQSVCQMVRRLYKDARNRFEAVGGREASYLRADTLNADIICGDVDPLEIERKLLEYEQFIQNTGFEDLYAYPLFYQVKWHMLAFFTAAMENSEVLADIHLQKAAAANGKMLELDAACGNQYGLWRGRLFAELITLFMSPKKASKTVLPALRNLMREAETNHYVRDAKLLNWLIFDGQSPEIIGLYRFVKYFPFVHQ